ncbi:ParB-like partition protein [mine drainage metagenome]|uniref:ParB-like partition protein n=2 Tax=mine drainage metagenome TaxID=410659 RepID=T1CRN1_9ZZZZ
MAAKAQDLRFAALTNLAEADQAELIIELALEDIVPDPDQPRKEFSLESLQELAASMRTHGQLELIKVRENPDPATRGTAPYMLVDGERRWRAALDTDITRLRAVVDPGSSQPNDVLDRQFALNVHRDNMTLSEQASYLERRRESLGTLEAMAAHTGLSISRISKILAATSATGAAGEARDAGLTKDADTLTTLRALEQHDPEAAAGVVREAKAKGGKISREQVKGKLSEAKDKAGKGRGKGKAKGTKGTPGGTGNVVGAAKGGTWEAPRSHDNDADYRGISLENDGPAKRSRNDTQSVVVELDWQGTDPDQSELWAVMVRKNGTAKLCMIAGTSVADYALVEFGQNGATEAFPLEGLRLCAVRYAA